MRQNLLTALDGFITSTSRYPNGLVNSGCIHEVNDAQIWREVARVDLEGFA